MPRPSARTTLPHMASPTRTRIDHIIYGTSDLEAAEAWITARSGFSAVAGGHHDGLGTHNRIVPLGDGSFIELLAVADHAQASRSPLGAAIQARITQRDGFLGWAVAVDDLGPYVERLGLSTTTVGRQGMTAHLAGVTESLAEPGLPFFIKREAQGTAPCRTVNAISWIELACDPTRLEHWLGTHTLPIRLVEAEPGVHAVGIGSCELRPATQPGASVGRSNLLGISSNRRGRDLTVDRDHAR
jgi:catechol 2,3-dioxygenase-like lactoylglutathione lyase family enzyme